MEKPTDSATVEEKAGLAGKNDAIGTTLGIVTFLGGLAILIATFTLAYGMFGISARETLGDQKDVTELGKTFGHVVLRIGLLLVMSVVGSVIAGLGVRLYFAARSKGTDN